MALALVAILLALAVFGLGSAQWAAAAPPPNLVTNGGFETGNTPPTGWTVSGITGIDVVQDNTPTSGWDAAEGLYSVDLNGFNPGTISQTFTTVVGQKYTLSFAMASNPGYNGTVTMNMTVAGNTVGYSFNGAGRSETNMGWTQHLYDFTATSTSTTLTFASTVTNQGSCANGPAACGPALDNVAVLPLYELTMISGTAAAGSQDPYVEVSKDGGVTWKHAYVATGHPWNTVSATNKWATCDSNLYNGCTNQTVDYRVQFNVPYGFFRSKIDIGMMPDNYGSVFLNGTQIAPVGGGEFTGNPPPAAPYASGPINIDSLLVPGINSLVFRVRDIGGLTGVNFAAKVSSNIDSPMTVIDSTPTVAANNASVTVNEGQTASNTGTFQVADPSDIIVVTASRGTVTQVGTNSGTWSWSLATTDGPSESGPVTITATDAGGPTATTTFNLTVNNVAPDLQISGANTAYWVNWTSANVAGGTASGVITLPDASTINVSLSTSSGGFYGAQTSGGTNFWVPSAPYISTQVPNAPPDSDVIQLQGGNSTVYTVTFSQPIVDPIMAILSLGQSGLPTTYDFNAPFTIVSQGVGYFGGCATCLAQLPGDILQGTEGHGTIKFLGTYSSFAWTVPTPETWHGFTFAVRSSQALAQTVIVNEGQTATNNGTWSDVPADTVTLTASVGTVIKNAGGTWSWSFPTTDGPSQSQTVTITATDEDGGVTQKQFPLVVNDVPPTLTVGGTATFTEDGAPVVVAPGLTITDPGNDPISTAKVTIGTGFVAAQDSLAVSGSLPAGLSSSYNSASGVLTINGAGSPSAYQQALRQVVYSNSSQNPTTAPRTITFNIGSQLAFTGTGHFYEFVSSGGILWTTAQANAQASSLYGLQGYLATITSAAENTFVKDKLAGNGWLGANDVAVEGTWRWQTGPESGQLLSYTAWNSGEPNNCCGGEDYLHMIGNAAAGPLGTWNDLPVAGGGGAYAVLGYVVEYGGMPGDPALQLSGNATVNVVPVNDPPTANAGGPYPVNEGSSVTLLGAGSDVDSGALTYAWDLDNNGSFETVGQNVPFVGVDGPAIKTVVLRVCDTGTPLPSLCTTAPATVTVVNVAPTATFNAPTSVIETELIQLSLTGAYDPSTVDIGAGLQYAFNCGSGYGPFSPSNTASCTPPLGPTSITVKGRVQDKDGGFTEYTRTVTITVPPAPAFSVNSTPPPGACICTPEIMNTDVNAIQHWWVKSDSSGTLTVTLRAHSVNNTDPETVIARIYPASGAGPALATITASYPGGTPAGTTVPATGSIPTTPNTVYLIRITTPAPTPPTQPHYSLKIQGALDAAIKSPTFASIEPTTGARWFLNIPSASETVTIRLFNLGTPLPIGPTLTATGAIYSPSGVLLGGPNTVIAPNPPGTFDVTASFLVPGPGKAMVVYTTDFHYRLERTGGTDNDVYLNWLTFGSGNLAGTVINGSGAPSTASGTVTIAAIRVRTTPPSTHARFT